MTPPPDDQRPSNNTFHNDASNYGMQGTARDVTINHYRDAPAPPTPSTLTPRQRAELLDRLALRYRERLDNALTYQVRLQLGLHTRPDAIDPTWRRLHLRGPVTSQPVAPGTPLLELFDGQQRQLLVLGEPGAGKTTLLVELAQALTARAVIDRQARIPVVLNLASWHSLHTLRDWLQRAINDLLGVSQDIAGLLAVGDDVLLLLDGLDEVVTERRAACIVAINAYLAEHDLAPPLVVSCRSREYADLGTRLQIASAVELKPLELPAVEEALAAVPAAHGVLAALQTDDLLRELASTPLMVNVMLLAHGGEEVPVVQARTLEERRQALWSAYVWRMFEQRPLGRWGVAQALRWLRWMSNSVFGAAGRKNILIEGPSFSFETKSLTDHIHLQENPKMRFDFLVDDIQPELLPSKEQFTIYVAANSIFNLILDFILISIFLPTIYHIISIDTILAIFLIFSFLIPHMVISVLNGYNIAHRAIHRSVYTDWSLFRAVEPLLYKQDRRVLGFIDCLKLFKFDLILEISIIFLKGYNIIMIRSGILPMHSFYMTLRGDIIIHGLLDGVFWVGVSILLVGWFMWLILFAKYGLIASLIIIAYVYLFVFFLGTLTKMIHSSALRTLVQHHLLRLVLSRAGLFPFRAVTFLEAMSERLLLERDGALYRFRHLLLRDFIADLSDAEIDELARGI